MRAGRPILALVSILHGLSAPPVGAAETASPTTIEQVRTLSAGRYADQPVGTTVRRQKLQEAGALYGARAGLEARLNVIAEALKAREAELDRVYAFQMLTQPVTGGVQRTLPAIDVAGAAIEIEPGGLRGVFVGQTIRIIEPAVIVARPPSWRDYLLLTFPRGADPDPALLPRDKGEQEIWAAAVDRGWQAGAEQADAMFSDAVARLERLCVGMITYRILLVQGMVQPAWVDIKETPTIVEDDQSQVDVRSLTVTAPAKLNDSRFWSPTVRQ
ncbi:hypothetical protein GE253_23085 [Niveispirillum sp. SYP-B3756]|uniref:type IV secretory system conjugative DNA transfer family protein n=1 Tax=Niveispirillum sp. SYP-B3756 TaxID=2662178 RepID=UPI001290BA80|nr:type IV secretory system conjugative DNA transfer family protein [Niveispirillum sp. SYP-B3756]MQP68207.1 hypothetical protein [Niveispirillum sp. SYP-B3756]